MVYIYFVLTSTKYLLIQFDGLQIPASQAVLIIYYSMCFHKSEHKLKCIKYNKKFELSSYTTIETMYIYFSL